jgi:hypothetical protein
MTTFGVPFISMDREGNPGARDSSPRPSPPEEEREKARTRVGSPVAIDDQGSVPLINTPLQRGVRKLKARRNRFHGFSQLHETMETVSAPPGPLITPLKRGVNHIATERVSHFRIRTIQSEHIAS